MKLSSVLVSAGIVLATMSGCGGGTDSAATGDSDKVVATSGGYCTSLATAAAEQFGGGEMEVSDLQAAYAAIRLVSKDAPDAVNADWKMMDEATHSLLTALDDIGITFDDLDAVLEGRAPEGSDVDPMEALSTLEPVLNTVTSPEFVQAQSRVQQHAKSECGVDLELGLGPEDE